MKRLLIWLTLLSSSCAHATVVSLAWDNDILFGSDGNYTAGMRVSWKHDDHTPTTCSTCLSSHLSESLHWLPGIGSKDAAYSMAYNLEQIMFTPQDISKTEPNYNDTPYTGLLRFEAWFLAYKQDRVTGYGIGVGTTGKDSMVEQSQKWVHEWTGSTEPQGWDNQLPQRTIINLSASHAQRLWRHQGRYLDSEIGWGANAEIGNWLVEAQTGIFYMFGRNLRNNILPSYTVLSSPASLPGMFEQTSFGWSVYMGIGGKWMPWSFIEEEGRRAGYTIDAEKEVGMGFLGASIFNKNWLFSLSLKKTTLLAQRSDIKAEYGSMNITWQF